MVDKAKPTKLDKYSFALGRRKTSSATVRLFEGAGESTINDKKVSDYVNTEIEKVKLESVFKQAGLSAKDFYFTSKVNGGGFSSQVEAVMLGLARAIVNINPDKKKALKDAGLMTRDPRMVERKKTGLHKARKREQYSKR